MKFFIEKLNDCQALLFGAERFRFHYTNYWKVSINNERVFQGNFEETKSFLIYILLQVKTD